MKKIKNYLFKNKETFAKGLCFKKMFLIFVLFSWFGCVYEEVLMMSVDYIKDETFNFVTKRGLLYFELSPIYGFGACLMIIIMLRKPRKKSEYFWLGALLGGAFEYSVSYLQQMFTGTTSWNYSHHFLNIGGRTTIPFMLFWGLMCYILITKLYPFFSKEIEKIPYNLGNIIYYILLIVISLDMFLSFSACIRMGLRDKGYKPLTEYGQFLDKYYNNARMKKSYTNMVIK